MAVEALSSRGLYGELKLKVQAVVRQYADSAVTEEGVAKVARGVAQAVIISVIIISISSSSSVVVVVVVVVLLLLLLLLVV